MVVRNPFIVSGYAGPEWFCDRKGETESLVSNALNGVNTTLTSIRRMGKTGLLWHTLELLNGSDKAIGIYADIFSTQNMAELTNHLGSAIMRAFPEKSSAGKKFLQLVKSLRPVLTYDPLNGQPQVSFDFTRPRQYEQSLENLLHFLEMQNKRILIAMDEFQQIATYPEKNGEAFLRSLIQPLKNVSFIFSGSSKHMLTEMFGNSKRPFFASTQFIYLREIERSEYLEFITELFDKHHFKISTDALECIADFSRLHTFYTQSICNRIFASNVKKIDLPHVHALCAQILKEQEPVFYQYKILLTPIQWKLLKAIAKENKVYKPTAKSFLEKYGIGTPSNIQRAMDALLTKEMVYQESDQQGTFACVYDCFLARWLEIQ
jgi:uncharacterized protein